jgi:site-specific recombinase XerD
LDPELLLKTSDMPKKPEYLPRPLPPRADRDLQIRLEHASCIYQQGLLLMRHTGLRIGELMSLEQNCIRSDYNGNKFLKVPLGKLDNERLVPLTNKALAVIEKLQNHGVQKKQKTWLLESQRGKKTLYDSYVKAMNKACEGLEIDGKMTTHRMRHSYATSLLSGGMSLVGVMKLLGHRDHRMTLRYAAITQETVRTEFFEALRQLEKKYKTDHLSIDAKSQADPIKALSDVKRWICKRSAGHTTLTRAARILNKRIDRIQTSLKVLFPDLDQPQK